MSSPLYHLEITYVGDFVAEYLKQDKLILFAELVPPDIAYYCAIHRPGDFINVLLPGQRAITNNFTYRITDVGVVATANLHKLGLNTLCSDGAFVQELHVRASL